MTILYTDGKNSDLIALCHALDRALDELAGGVIDRSAYTPYNQLDSIRDAWVAYIDNVPVGCAALRPCDGGRAEVKRVFVHPDYRGRGVATALMDRLTSHAVSLGCRALILETGAPLVASIALYKKLGFTVTENYGPYVGMADSICMQKVLG